MRLVLTACLILVAAIAAPVFAQFGDPGVNGRSGGHTIYGDVKVEGDEVGPRKSFKIDLILYTETRTIIARDTVGGNGRYRFNNIPTGLYDLIVENEGQEIARYKIDLTSPLIEERKQDLTFEIKGESKPVARDTISAADRYERNQANAELFAKASEAIDTTQYALGADLLQKIVSSDPKDFPAWTELGNVNLLQKKYSEAETDYLHAVDLRPNFFVALLNFGRTELLQQKYDVAIEVLARAIKVHPESPDANYWLGETYLEMKKGSLAVGYLNEAIRLDPIGKAEAHLRLAALYNGAGMKDKAAAEYEQFLKKKPNYPGRKALEKYIAENKKP